MYSSYDRSYFSYPSVVTFTHSSPLNNALHTALQHAATGRLAARPVLQLPLHAGGGQAAGARLPALRHESPHGHIHPGPTRLGTHRWVVSE